MSPVGLGWRMSKRQAVFSSENLGALLSALPDPAFVLTRTGRYAAVFGGSDPRYYHDGSGLVGLSIRDVLNEDKASWFIAVIARALDTNTLHIVEYELAGRDVKGLSEDGPAEPIWFEGRVHRLDFQVAGEDAVLWVASNITTRHELETKLRSASETDALTNLRNRRHFEERACAELERSSRYGEPVSLALLDVDHFKVINDTCGHRTGDDVLVELARLVESCIRAPDLAARWGGEEFVLLLPCTKVSGAVSTAEKLRAAIASNRFTNGLTATASVGVAEWDGAESLDSWFARADAALYRAKREGRNRVSIALRWPDAESSTSRLPMLHWHERYESGDAVIDEHHQRLLCDVNHAVEALVGVSEAPNSADRKSAARDIMDTLLQHLDEHYTTEEQRLAELEWEGLDAHRKAHADLLATVRALHASLGTADAAHSAATLVDFLFVDVIANHLLRADKSFFPILARR